MFRVHYIVYLSKTKSDINELIIQAKKKIDNNNATRQTITIRLEGLQQQTAARLITKRLQPGQQQQRGHG